MKRSHSFANVTIASLVLLLVQCSGESSDDDSNEGGAAGESPSAGKGGAAGSSAGSAGKGGGAGSSGKGGSAGSSGASAGTGGSSGGGAGTAGSAGSSAGESGSGGGDAGESGAAGFSGEGSGGAAGEASAGAAGEGSGGAAGEGGAGTAGDGSGGVAGGAGGAGGDSAGVAGSGGEGGGTPAIPGDVCGSAVTAVAGSYDGESTATFSDDYSLGACFSWDTNGPDRVYQVRIPSANRLDLGIDPLGTLDLAVALVSTPESNCVAEPWCIVARDLGGQGGPEALSFANDSGADRDVYLVVDGFDSQAGGGSFDLDVALAPSPVGDLCQNPLPLGEGTQIAGTLAGAGIGHDYNIDPCFEAAYFTPGPDVAYRLEVPAGSTLTVTIDPSDALDPALFLQVAQGSTCDRNSCLDGADDGFQGDNETVTYTNPGTVTQTVYVIVDSFAPAFSTPGPFHLDVNITP